MNNLSWLHVGLIVGGVCFYFLLSFITALMLRYINWHEDEIDLYWSSLISPISFWFVFLGFLVKYSKSFLEER